MYPYFCSRIGKKVIYEIKKYKKCTNLSIFSKVAEANPLDAGERYNRQNWTPSPIEWIKFNTDALKARLNL